MTAGGSNGNGSTPYYGRARIAGGLALIFGAIFLSIIGAITHTPADSVQIGLMLGTGTVLLGVETGKKLLGG